MGCVCLVKIEARAGNLDFNGFQQQPESFMVLDNVLAVIVCKGAKLLCKVVNKLAPCSSDSPPDSDSDGFLNIVIKGTHFSTSN